VDIALPTEGVFHNLVFVSIRKTYPKARGASTLDTARAAACESSINSPWVGLNSRPDHQW